ncbi:hypothetical protein B1R32_1284 [Abditibacterium utsteinense]|uniref:PAP2 superfamily protein n=1 Tax=Abditibacterium utsteinense TaxID=1960156 RepID=A0A2S8SP47_9BACT|nr:hypothetical protein [Abditibacterium utsteinense]PQV62567.1 hypothetical protein B1R32_1284 [Abditibacterium utsteinense]
MPLSNADLTPDDEKPAADVAETVDVVAEGLAGELGVPAPPRRTPADSLAFVLSAVLSPYLVIPFGTLGIIYARSPSEKFLLWAAISIFFSTALPVIYVLIGMARGTISDVHVMERSQRGGPFAVAILGGFVAAYVLHRLQASPSVWGLSLLLSINGLVIGIITTFTKISVHVSVLASTVLCAAILHPELSPYWLLWMIPALIWARTKRGRHSAWQGIGGALVALLVTSATLYALGLGDRIGQFIQRAI